jgi:hypothetical protein
MKGRRRIVLSSEHGLHEFGYSDVRMLSRTKRRAALRRAVGSSQAHDSAVRVMRRLNALYVLNRNREPQLSGIFLEDRDWVGRTFLGWSAKGSGGP